MTPKLLAENNAKVMREQTVRQLQSVTNVTGGAGVTPYWACRMQTYGGVSLFADYGSNDWTVAFQPGSPKYVEFDAVTARGSAEVYHIGEPVSVTIAMMEIFWDAPFGYDFTFRLHEAGHAQQGKVQTQFNGVITNYDILTETLTYRAKEGRNQFVVIKDILPYGAAVKGNLFEPGQWVDPQQVRGL